jgi:hypothetical protein
MGYLRPFRGRLPRQSHEAREQRFLCQSLPVQLEPSVSRRPMRVAPALGLLPASGRHRSVRQRRDTNCLGSPRLPATTRTIFWCCEARSRWKRPGMICWDGAQTRHACCRARAGSSRVGDRHCGFRFFTCETAAVAVVARIEGQRKSGGCVPAFSLRSNAGYGPLSNSEIPNYYTKVLV